MGWKQLNDGVTYNCSCWAIRDTHSLHISKEHVIIVIPVMRDTSGQTTTW